MPQVAERWLTPAPNSHPGKDLVRLDDGTYCWADHNTNNFDQDTYLLIDLQNDPTLDGVMLDVIQNGGPPDIIGPNLIGQPAPRHHGGGLGFIDDDDDYYDDYDDEYYNNDEYDGGGFTHIPAATHRPRVPDEPKNNDGRTHCYKCKQPVTNAAGGMYQLCKNQQCEWFDK